MYGSYDTTSKYDAESRSTKANPLKLFATHPLGVLNSMDDILHPVGSGVLPVPCAIGNAASGDTVNCSAYCSAPPVVSTAMFTTLTLTSASKPVLENRNLVTVKILEHD